MEPVNGCHLLQFVLLQTLRQAGEIDEVQRLVLGATGEDMALDSTERITNSLYALTTDAFHHALHR